MSNNEGQKLIFNILSAVLDPNQQIRTNAENQLNELSTKPGYCPSLVEFTLNNQLPDHIRQMASIIAKNFIKKNWERVDEDHEIIKISENDKQILRSILPRGLMDPSKRIRSSISMSIASIAHWDWPTLWPNLAEELVKCLSSNNSNLVDGAVSCLEMFSSGENLTSEHIPILVQTAFPALLKLFGTNTSTDSMRSSVLVIVNSCISWLGVMQSEVVQEHNPKKIVGGAKQLVMKIVEQWFPFVFVILNQDDKNLKDFSLKIHSINFLMSLMKFFSKSCATVVEKLLPVVWKSFFGSFPLYEEKIVNAKEEDLELNEDGYNTFNAYVLNLVDVIIVMLEKPKFQKIIGKELKMVVQTLMGLSQITNEQISQLLDDPNEFVSNEEDEFVSSTTIRISCRELYFNLIETFDKEAITAILGAMGEINNKSTQLFNNKVANWWKYRETILHTVQTVSEYLVQYPKLFNLNDFFSSFVIVDCKSDNPFLKMKSFDCVASLAEKEKVNEKMSTFFTEQALNAINNEKESLGVKLFGAKAIYSCSPFLGEFMHQLSPQILQSLCKVLPLTNQNTIHYVIETLNEVMKLSEKVVAENHVVLLSSFFKLWTSVNLDPSSMKDIIESISIVSSLDVAQQMVQSFILPQIVKYLEDDKLDSYIKESTVQLLGELSKRSKEPLGEGNMMKNCFLSMIKLCHTTDDNSVLQEATMAIPKFLINSSEEIIFNNNFFNSNSPLKIVFDFISRFINPNNNSLDLEEGGLKIGSLLLFLYLKYANKIEGVLVQIMKNIVLKLGNCQTESFKVGLLLLFARFAADNPSNLLTLLQNISKEIQQDAISIVLKVWLENVDSFLVYGGLASKFNVIALTKLFLLNDQRVINVQIQSVQIQDDENDNKISSRTRSKSNKLIQQVSSYEKIFELVVTEYCSFLLERDNQKKSTFKNNPNIDPSQAVNPFFDEDGEKGDFIDDKDFDDDDDFDEYDDMDNDLQSVLKDAFNEQMEEDEVDDPTYEIDPLKDMEMEPYLKGFLGSFSSQNAQGFNLLFNKLPPVIQKKFQRLTLSQLQNK